MNQTTFRPHGLIWKEIRLVMPLILMLIGAAVLLVTLWSMFQRSSQVMEFATQFIPVMWPILYAAGAGAILVSQERENRTLWWFISLPISAQRVFWTKTAIAFVGLAIMLCMGATFAWMNGRLSESELGLHTILLCVFITMSGIYTSWRMLNSFASLIALVPLSLVPIFFPIYLGDVIPGATRLAAFSGNGLIWSSVIGTAIVLWLAYRAAMRTLLPTESHLPLRHNADAWREPWQSTIPVTQTMLPPATPTRWLAFRSSLTSLVWQSVHHNRLVLVGLIAMALLSFAYQWIDSSAIGSLSLVALSVCWLGVFAFSGDGSAKRLRFLADRGVSPTKVWLGRHAANLSLVAIAILIYGVVSTLVILGRRHDASLWPSFAMVSLVLWLLYGMSQWTSQLVRILPAAAVLGPVMGGVVAYWLSFSAIELGTPRWLIVLCSCIPMLATWASMRLFMDEASQLRIWIRSIVPAVALCLLPMVPAAKTIMNWPNMSASTRVVLLAEAKLAVQGATQPQSMMLKDLSIREMEIQTSNDLFSAMSDEKALEFLEEYSFAPDARLQLGDGLHDATVPLAVDLSILENSLAIASLHVLQYQADPSREQAEERLGAWIKTLTMMTKRFRASPRWLDQEAADIVEIWLTQNLSEDSMKSFAESEISKQAREMLADSANRSHSRRRAVLASWHDYLDNAYRGDLGGLHAYEWMPSVSSTIQSYVRHRNVDAVVDRAIRFIEAGDRGESTLELRTELHRLTTSPAIAFEAGPYSDRIRASKDSGMAISARQTLTFPANQWYAGWEADAKQLKP